MKMCVFYSKTKFKGRIEVMFGEVVGRVSGVKEMRAREEVVLLLSRWLLAWK